MNNSNTDILHYLNVIAEEGNMTHAAEKLFISQPALTNFLNRLEKKMNVTLFDRTQVPIRPTVAGMYYIRELEKLTQQELALKEHLRGLIINPEKKVNISIGRNRGSVWLPVLMKKIYKKHPDILVQIFEERDVNVPYLLTNGEIDIAIMETYICHPDIKYINLADEFHCFIANRELLKLNETQLQENSYKTPLDISPEELSQWVFICPMFGSKYNPVTSTMMNSYRFYPQRVLHVSNAITAVRLAEEGIGITYQNPAYVRLLKNASPCFLMPGGKPALTHLYLAFTEQNTTQLKKSIIQIIQAAMG